MFPLLKWFQINSTSTNDFCEAQLPPPIATVTSIFQGSGPSKFRACRARFWLCSTPKAPSCTALATASTAPSPPLRGHSVGHKSFLGWMNWMKHFSRNQWEWSDSLSDTMVVCSAEFSNNINHDKGKYTKVMDAVTKWAMITMSRPGDVNHQIRQFPYHPSGMDWFGMVLFLQVRTLFMQIFQLDIHSTTF